MCWKGFYGLGQQTLGVPAIAGQVLRPLCRYALAGRFAGVSPAPQAALASPDVGGHPVSAVLQPGFAARLQLQNTFGVGPISGELRCANGQATGKTPKFLLPSSHRHSLTPFPQQSHPAATSRANTSSLRASGNQDFMRSRISFGFSEWQVLFAFRTDGMRSYFPGGEKCPLVPTSSTSCCPRNQKPYAGLPLSHTI